MREIVEGVYVVLIIVGAVNGNVLNNGDFEDAYQGNWVCNMCELGKSTDSYNGQYSGQVVSR